MFLVVYSAIIMSDASKVNSSAATSQWLVVNGYNAEDLNQRGGKKW
jgi:hypothetical protein